MTIIFPNVKETIKAQIQKGKKANKSEAHQGILQSNTKNQR